jgi:hypothetical protein
MMLTFSADIVFIEQEQPHEQIQRRYQQSKSHYEHDNKRYRHCWIREAVVNRQVRIEQIRVMGSAVSEEGKYELPCQQDEREPITATYP